MKPLFSSAIVLLIATLFLAGCREEEQNRPLSYAPGVYQGKSDTGLKIEALQAIRDRGQQKVGVFSRGVGAGQSSTKTSLPLSTLPPPVSTPAGGLGSRAIRQNF